MDGSKKYSQSPTYSELQRLQVHEFAPCLQVKCNFEYIRPKESTIEIKVAQNSIFNKIRKYENS